MRVHQQARRQRRTLTLRSLAAACPSRVACPQEKRSWSVKVPADARHFKFRGLTPGGTYVLAVRACGVGGWGKRAALKVIAPGTSTLPQPCPRVTLTLPQQKPCPTCDVEAAAAVPHV